MPQGTHRDDPWIQRVAAGLSVFAGHTADCRQIGRMFNLPPAAVAGVVSWMATSFGVGVGVVFEELAALERRLRQRGKQGKKG